MAETKNADIGCLAGIGALLLLPFMRMADGFVVMLLWRWFAVPLLHLPSLGLVGAIGLSVLIGTLTHHYSYAVEDPKYTLWVKVGSWFVLRCIILATGYVAHLFL